MGKEGRLMLMMLAFRPVVNRNLYTSAANALMMLVLQAR